MPPGYIVTQKEINEAHRLRKLGKKNKEISQIMGRSLPTVASMLKKPRCAFA
jgi:DNA-binding CsgD family transcriptional regulator